MKGLDWLLRGEGFDEKIYFTSNFIYVEKEDIGGELYPSLTDLKGWQIRLNPNLSHA